jgi:hypothetical protein
LFNAFALKRKSRSSDAISRRIASPSVVVYPEPDIPYNTQGLPGPPPAYQALSTSLDIGQTVCCGKNPRLMGNLDLQILCFTTMGTPSLNGFRRLALGLRRPESSN